MLLRRIISAFAVFVCIAALLAPVLIDAHHLVAAEAQESGYRVAASPLKTAEPFYW